MKNHSWKKNCEKFEYLANLIVILTVLLTFVFELVFCICRVAGRSNYHLTDCFAPISTVVLHFLPSCLSSSFSSFSSSSSSSSLLLSNLRHFKSTIVQFNPQKWIPSEILMIFLFLLPKSDICGQTYQKINISFKNCHNHNEMNIHLTTVVKA